MTCTRCGQPLIEDLTFNTTMARYGLPQRRFACLNGHSDYRGLVATLDAAEISSRRVAGARGRAKRLAESRS